MLIAVAMSGVVVVLARAIEALVNQMGGRKRRPGNGNHSLTQLEHDLLVKTAARADEIATGQEKVVGALLDVTAALRGRTQKGY